MTKVHVAPAAGHWPAMEDLSKMTNDSIDDVDLARKQLNMIAGGEGLEGVKLLASKLQSDIQQGLSNPCNDKALRQELFGTNAFAEKVLKRYWEFVWEGLHDKILLLLILVACAELIIHGIMFGTEPDDPHHKKDVTWIYEPIGVYVTVLIIANIQAFLDWSRDREFEKLSEEFRAGNKRFILRGGEKLEVQDEEIVVGDVVLLNAHTSAVIPADGIYIEGDGMKCDEGALTGEPHPIPKNHEKNPFLISGTTVNSGTGRMLVVAVGKNSVSGRIKASVYDSAEEEESPLFTKLDLLADRIGQVALFVASVFLICTLSINLGFRKMHLAGRNVQGAPGCPNPDQNLRAIGTPEQHCAGFDLATQIVKTVLLSIGVLAMAIPEGLPLALTLALAFTSMKMSKEANLVKTLASCETMGSATTICTDKTGTLTTNRMTVRGAYVGENMFKPPDNGHIGPVVKENGEVVADVKELVSTAICICTMDESSFKAPEKADAELKFTGNPTECALLKFADDLGFHYEKVRAATTGRSDETKNKGSCKAFTSARKMMSWAVPRKEGGFRVYCKGASEIILSRIESQLNSAGQVLPVDAAKKEWIVENIINFFANKAMRTIGIAYRDVKSEEELSEMADGIENADGSKAFMSETNLILISITGIEDPLRAAVPGAVQMCYQAGIDVRMVTGDNVDTAVAIARSAGIIREEHFDANGKLKPSRAMLGKTFRDKVHTMVDGKMEFNQEAFDRIWPYLRVLARSSPEDKLTLANGLNKSKLYSQKDLVKKFKEEGITIFPDGQVIAMTGDGTNDAPALARADVGFAMGIAGTQIAMDAANIILLDDNFASIVTAAKWGRNVYDSIQKFLQFQLSVNVTILAIVLLNCFSGLYYEIPKELPLCVMQMLWLNLIMDSFASLSLASEPPTQSQMKRPPVNRQVFIITRQMWWNILGQSLYQIFCLWGILTNQSKLPGCRIHEAPPGIPATGPMSVHYTLFFNVFVMLQLFNEINARMLLGEWWVFDKLFNNWLFVTMWVFTFIIQIIIGNWSGKVFQTTPMPPKTWGICFGFSAVPLAWQQGINLIKRLVDYCLIRKDGTQGGLTSHVGGNKHGLKKQPSGMVLKH